MGALQTVFIFETLNTLTFVFLKKLKTQNHD